MSEQIRHRHHAGASNLRAARRTGNRGPPRGGRCRGADVLPRSPVADS